MTTFLWLGTATSAAAAPGDKDKEALKLHDQAMDDDYLAVQLDKAEKKLNDALKKCGKDGCSPEVIGKLHIALGTVLGAGRSDLPAAKEEFTKALAADPKAALGETFATDELRKAFEEAKSASSTGEEPAAGGGDEEEATDEGDEAAKPGKAGGDIAHTPMPEQMVNTPVPIYVEIPEDVGAEAVTLRYKPFGGKKWTSIEMKKLGDGWSAEVPCDAVTTTGDLKYYVIAKDAAGDPVGQAGTLKAPHRIPIKNEIEGAAPSLPGKKPPSQCAAKEDCPPGLPGCPDAKAGGPRGDKGWGASCESTQECQSGYSCLNGSCEEGGAGGSEPTGPGGKKNKNVVGLYGGLDMLLIAGADSVCTGDDASYSCFYQDGSGQFYGKPASKTGTNGIAGGFGVAGGRVTVGYDRMLSDKINLGLGLRLGFAFGGSPSSDSPAPGGADWYQAPPQAKSFMPIHAEGRATYYVGGNTVEAKKVKPFVFIGGGLAQVNASVPVAVCDRAQKNGRRITDLSDPPSSGACPDGSVERKLDAYQITGLNFAGVGGGATFGLTDHLGVAAEVKVMFMVPTFGIVIAPTVGPVYAF